MGHVWMPFVRAAYRRLLRPKNTWLSRRLLYGGSRFGLFIRWLGKRLYFGILGDVGTLRSHDSLGLRLFVADRQVGAEYTETHGQFSRMMPKYAFYLGKVDTFLEVVAFQ